MFARVQSDSEIGDEKNSSPNKATPIAPYAFRSKRGRADNTGGQERPPQRARHQSSADKLEIATFHEERPNVIKNYNSQAALEEFKIYSHVAELDCCLAVYLIWRWLQFNRSIQALNNDAFKESLLDAALMLAGYDAPSVTDLVASNEKIRELLSVIRSIDKQPTYGLERPGMAIIARNCSDESTGVKLAVHLQNGECVFFDCQTMEVLIYQTTACLLAALNEATAATGWSWTFLRARSVADRNFLTTLGNQTWERATINQITDAEKQALLPLCLSDFEKITKSGHGVGAFFKIHYSSVSFDLINIGGRSQFKFDNESKRFVLHSVDSLQKSESILTALYDKSDYQAVSRLLAYTDKALKKRERDRLRFDHGVYYDDSRTIKYYLKDGKPLTLSLQAGESITYKTVRLKGKRAQSRLREYWNIKRRGLPPSTVGEVRALFASHLLKENIHVFGEAEDMRSSFIRVVDDTDLDQRVDLLRGDMGTGKTELLEKFLQQIPKDWRVLTITHRRSLSHELARRLKLTNYLQHDDKSGKWVVEVDTSASRLCISLNSLHQLPHELESFDVIILDEIEGIQQHFVSAALDKPLAAQQHLEYWLRRSTRVIAADANLAPDTGTLFLSRLCRHERVFLHATTWRRSRNLTAYRCRSRGELKKNFIKLLQRNEQRNGDPECVIVAANVRKDIEEGRALIDEFNPKHKDQVLLVSSETMREPRVQRFLTDPNNEAKNYVYILYSPSISSGLSITIERFHRLYCFASAASNNINELDQMLWRVRSFSPHSSSSGNNASLIYHVDRCRGKPDGSLSDEKAGYKRAIEWRETMLQCLNSLKIHCSFDCNVPRAIRLEYTAMAARLVAKECRDRLYYSERFDRRLLERGLDIYPIAEHPTDTQELDDADCERLETTCNDHSAAQKEGKIQRLLNAEVIDGEKAKELIRTSKRESGAPSDEEQAALDRYALVAFYHEDCKQPLTRSLIETDRNGQLRNSIQQFAFERCDFKYNVLQDSQTLSTEQRHATQHTSRLHQQQIANWIFDIINWKDDDKPTSLVLDKEKADDHWTRLSAIRKIAGNTFLKGISWPTKNDVKRVATFWRNFLKERGFMLGESQQSKAGGKTSYTYDIECPPEVDTIGCAKRLILRSPIAHRLASLSSVAQKNLLVIVEQHEVGVFEIAGQNFDLLWKVDKETHTICGGYLDDGRSIVISARNQAAKELQPPCRAQIDSQGHRIDNQGQATKDNLTDCSLNVEYAPDGSIIRMGMIWTRKKGPPSSWEKTKQKETSELELLLEFCWNFGLVNPDVVRMQDKVAYSRLMARLQEKRVFLRSRIPRFGSPFGRGDDSSDQGREWVFGSPGETQREGESQ